MIKSSFFLPPRGLHLLVLLLFFAPLRVAGAFATPFQSASIQVSGNDVDLVNGQADVSRDDNTYMGVVNTNSDFADQSYTIKNTGDVTMQTLSVAIGGEFAGAFSLESAPEATLDAGNSTTFTIGFDPSSEGLLTADITISSSEAEDFTFRVGGIGDDDVDPAPCDSCFGFAASDPNVCAGEGECVAKDTCKCKDFHIGSNCQTPLWWADGTVTQTRQFDFSQHIAVGPHFLERTYVYRIKVKINQADVFPSTKGYSFGVVSLPPSDLTHKIGDNDGEWGYYQLSGELLHDGQKIPFGEGVDVGDTILVEYDAPNKTLSFFIQKDSVGDFELLGDGPAFTDVVAPPNKVIGFGASVRCFGSCSITLVN